MKLIDLEEFERKLSLRCNTYDTRSFFVSSTLLDVLNTMECVSLEKLAAELKAYCRSTKCEDCPFWRGDADGYCALSDGVAPCNWEVQCDDDN